MIDNKTLCMDAAGETGEVIFRAPSVGCSGETVTQFDAAVAAELPLVSTVAYNSHEICKWFAANVRERLAAPPKCPTCKGSTYVITGHGEFAGAEECPTRIGGQPVNLAATGETS